MHIRAPCIIDTACLRLRAGKFNDSRTIRPARIPQLKRDHRTFCIYNPALLFVPCIPEVRLFVPPPHDIVLVADPLGTLLPQRPVTLLLLATRNGLLPN